MLLGALPAGVLVDRHGERRAVGIGVFAMAMLALVASFAPNFATMFVLFLAASIGAALVSPGGARALVAWVPRRRLGLALSVRQTGVMLGGLLGALMLPPVALLTGWRTAFRVAAILAIGCVVLFALAYREPPGVARRGAPLKLRSLRHNRPWLAATAYGFVFMGVQGVAVSYLALYLHQGGGLTVVAAADLLAVLQLGGLVGRLATGFGGDRLARRAPLMVLLGVVATLAAVGFSFAGPGTPLALLGALSFLLGVSGLGWNALAITVISEAVPSDATATATGAGISIAFSAMFVISPLFGLLTDRQGGYALSWAALAGWCVLGTLSALLIREGKVASGGARPPGVPVT
jgi:MFS family permease